MSKQEEGKQILVDGYVLLEINEKGDVRVVEEPRWTDFRCEDVLFYDAEGAEQLAEQLPADCRDVQVLVGFEYEVTGGISYEGECDFEEYFHVLFHTITLKPAKAFQHLSLSRKVKIMVGENRLADYEAALKEQINPDDKAEEDIFSLHGRFYNDSLMAKELLEEIGEWEEFHDEDFTLIIEQPHNPILF